MASLLLIAELVAVSSCALICICYVYVVLVDVLIILSAALPLQFLGWFIHVVLCLAYEWLPKSGYVGKFYM